NLAPRQPSPTEAPERPVGTEPLDGDEERRRAHDAEPVPGSVAPAQQPAGPETEKQGVERLHDGERDPGRSTDELPDPGQKKTKRSQRIEEGKRHCMPLRQNAKEERIAQRGGPPQPGGLV